METKTTKEKTIDELLTQRATLLKSMCTWHVSMPTQTAITYHIEKIDGLIKQLNGIA